MYPIIKNKIIKLRIKTATTKIAFIKNSQALE